LEAALSAAKVAFGLIDMRRHKGEHPRMGALDVCPFIPVSGVTVEECVELARRFGAKLAAELDVPVFLYGAAATAAYRKTMPQIRAGEYEGLAEKLAQPDWQPDFGPSVVVPSWGATVTGVRKFLIAYNVNMVATKEQAHGIALNLREKGRGDGQPGRLKAVQGIGWWLAEANIAQISLNLTDMDVTPMHVAYEEAKKDAAAMGVAVTGSEVVGLIPLAALLEAAEYYMKAEGLMILEEDQKIHLAINRLGLSTLAPFKPKERIIEYCLAAQAAGKDRLKNLSVEDFVKSVGARTAAPGGGSVAALVGGLGAALAAMVGKLSYGRKQWAAIDGQMREVLPRLHNAMLEIIEMIDADTEAFNAYMAAMKMAKATEAEQAAREAAMQKEGRPSHEEKQYIVLR
jgi:glutamate formiminotransferase/formiminotetrahydrofolate cyclodeaminase